ncbi:MULTISPECIES: cobaltochelatase CobT-related protein [Burkholderia]|jgi:cobaltochelatase CobT|uniref:Cobalamin biosynthesis protein CobT n=3 Tax=Burkholderia contaminans TaxID=488447 RepID=A0A1E3FKQ5_9BURK|nr:MULTISPECIES: cobalamin biosynthesis protein CobT [Burkholderia]KKL42162.1 cobalamin biosynthesis protein CobT [Burkholderia contaminans LMG 23361]MBA9829108.1 cobalamin biosynthesis protein CobT [Burkholderia contaminans]MBA9837995.1 cobalamin biosynthesis protein CobT [Burkholderia contaminans]MBA9862526.1 cobalamin biosynthesis protein CobT [Burkholderia contaminans]MBA9908678.1 cobalamin biosynthesis protein CobT [Burkholderia contaminans]
MDRDDDARSLHLTRLARTLAQRHGIEVRFAQHGPVAQPDLLVLPDTLLAGDVDDDAIIGLVDLYAARIRFGAIDDIAALASPVVRAIAQAIDDRRAAGCLAAIYPGATTFLQRMRAATAADTHRRWPRMAWRDRLVWRIERALWSEPPPSIERVPSLDATMAASSDLVDAARAATSTSDSIRAAHRIVERVRALASAGANNMMFTADPGSTIDSDSIAAEFESDGQGAPDDSRAPVSAESGGGAIADTASSAEAPTPGDAAPRTIRLSADNRPLLSVPLTTAFDTVTDFTGNGEPARWHRLRSAARAQTEPLKLRLERALKVDEQTRWKREQERGELDRMSLAHLVTSPGYRTPFRVPRAAPGRDAAVSLLIDCSGSMAGRKIELARLCAAALCDALTQLGFACEVLGYSSVEDAAMRAHYQRWIDAGHDTFGYNRFVERLDLRVYKRFDSDNPSGLACIECGHENPDGEALSWAAERLLAKRARRRILMVLSDGYPATGDGNPTILRTDLRARVDALRERRVELIGVGILDDAVETFYPVSRVVEHLHELPGAAFSVLSDTLLDRR